MPQSLLTGQLKGKPTYRVWCLYSSFVHGPTQDTLSLSFNSNSTRSSHLYLSFNSNSTRSSHLYLSFNSNSTRSSHLYLAHNSPNCHGVWPKKIVNFLSIKEVCICMYAAVREQRGFIRHCDNSSDFSARLKICIFGEKRTVSVSVSHSYFPKSPSC